MKKKRYTKKGNYKTSKTTCNNKIVLQKDLFDSKISPNIEQRKERKRVIRNAESKEILEITVAEIIYELKKMNKRKAADPDNIQKY